VGIALLLSGIGFGVLAVGGALRTAAPKREAETPATNVATPAIPIA
jgi:hypothetical protein